MIQQMTSGGFKVFSIDDNGQHFIGAYNNQKLAEEVDKLGRPLTVQEFDNLFGL